MKQNSKISALFLIALFSSTVPVLAKDAPKESAKTDASAPGNADQEKMMKAFEEAGKVTDHHKALEYLVGDWTTQTKWWQAPATIPQESPGKAHFEPILGGRFYRQTMEGTMMGKPFNGIGDVGYDNMKKKYVTVWMDDMSTGVFQVEGESTDKGKTITSSGEFLCPADGKMKSVKTVMKRVSKNEMRYMHYDKDPNGKEFKALEVIYKR